MNTLRLTQVRESDQSCRVEVSLEGEGLVRQTATARFRFELMPLDHEDIRWYLEDYLQFPHEPASTIAARIESRIAEIGAQLFNEVFQSSRDARDLWAELRPKLDDTRVEVVTSVADATAIPWELIRDPKTDTPLALRASAFVHAHPQASQRPTLPKINTGPIRILLVICRPSGDEDAPFRSVASQLIKGLGAKSRDQLELNVLRPATFGQLSRMLRQAKADGQPYHVVHFDGHGMYADMPDSVNAVTWLRRLVPVVLAGARTGKHGYLLFENPGHLSNLELVDGPTLGRLLVETDVPLLVLNACRSAHAEPLSAPQPGAPDLQSEIADPHSAVRGFGSLAQEVMDAGVAGVVAMRYNVYVVTAAQFVADLYATLVRGQSFGEAVTMGRKQLAAEPRRSIGFEPIPLQDWCVPVVYEAAPIKVFDKQDAVKLNVDILAGKTAGGASIDERLPKSPDVGFFGRDETLLALDRALDRHHVVLLHANAGSGKTSTAAEFARWYSQTGGVEGPVLFTSFKQFIPLSQVLDRIGQVFGGAMAQSGVDWLALDDNDRRNVALQVLKQVPVLWIWDNVEPIHGFPAGTQSAWSIAEQQELVEFLRAAAQGKAKFLLTSRRDERDWLGDTLPIRVIVPPMPMQERVQLSRALAERRGRHLRDVDDWRPLLRFTGGNPMTITVLVGQALRDGVKTREQIELFVEQLRSGQTNCDDEESELRERSLAASLGYGFDHAFGESELKQLAVLFLFQEAVETQLLCAMGDTSSPYCLDELKGITPQQAADLLHRASDIGLLTQVENAVPQYAEHCFLIHPAVPWFLRRIAQKYGVDSGLRATRAFVEAMAFCGQSMVQWCSTGNDAAFVTLAHYETNLSRAMELALTHRWLDPLVRIVAGLFHLYADCGRWIELDRQANRLLAMACDGKPDSPRAEWENVWKVAADCKSNLLGRAGDVVGAERLQSQAVQLHRQAALSALAKQGECEDLDDENRIRALAGALVTLGNIQRAINWAHAIATFREAIALAQRIKDKNIEGDSWLFLGIIQLALARDVEEAEVCFEKAIQAFPSGSYLNRSKVLYELGMASQFRYQQALKEAKPTTELGRYLESARDYFEQAIALTPSYAAESLALRHAGLSAILRNLGQLGAAVIHGQRAIQFDELVRNEPRAAIHRLDLARTFAANKQFANAIEYARAAKRAFETCATLAVLVETAEQLIKLAEAELAASTMATSVGGHGHQLPAQQQ